LFDEGRIFAYSPSRAKILWQRTGSSSRTIGFGTVAVLSDRNGDGIPEILTANDSLFPRRVLLDGKTLETMHDFLNSEVAALGYRKASFDDLNGDGFPEFGMSPHYPDSSVFDGRGIVFVYNRATLEPMRRYEGLDSATVHRSFDGDTLGHAISSVGDIDLDGIPDYVIGTKRRPGGLAEGRLLQGKFYLYSGKTSEILVSYHAANRFHNFLGTFSPLGDYR
jgi:hypothetical protein